jgi:hypothetical protein
MLLYLHGRLSRKKSKKEKLKNRKNENKKVDY